MIWVLVLIFLVFLVWLISRSTYESEVDIEVHAPREHAFAVAMDESLMGDWLSNDQMVFQSIENIEGAPREIGSKWQLRYQGKGREVRMTQTITDYVENKLFGFDIEDTFARFHVSMEFTDLGDKTGITERTTGNGKGLAARAMLLFFGKSAEKTKQTMYFKLKELIESRLQTVKSEEEE